MTIAALIAPVLPRLRRHARALAGSQASGDAYVGALLEALVADPSMFDKYADPKVEAFRLLTAMWPSLQVHAAEESGQQWEKAAARKLGALTPLARQAFLLTAVEDFSAAETAIVLGKAEPEIAGLLDQAAREISEQVRTRVLIIEDEPLIAHDIETLVGDLGHEVTGVARTHAEANKLASETAPGLVLADIQLADGSSGIDAVNDIIKTFNVPVIFITAFPERLLTGEKPEPAFLITKPFIADMVKAIISQALFFDRSAGSEAAA